MTRPRPALSLLLGTVLLLASCSGDEPPAPSAGAAPAGPARAAPERERDADEEAAPAAPKEMRPIDAAQVGRVEGVALFRGEPPLQKRLGMGTDRACTDHATPPLTETVVVENGRLRDAFVYVKRGHEGWIVPPPPAAPALLSQEGCLYVPHALAVQTGQELRVHNGDPTTHNVNMKARRNGIASNTTQGQGQADLSFTFERREHSIPFRCDIHPWMGAWLYVQDHPWFALSGADGTFAIEGLPAGRYTLEAVHEELGTLRAEVTVAAGETARVELVYPR